MCSKEEVHQIVGESEHRIMSVMHEELGKLRQEVRGDRESSHMALSKSISNLGAEFLSAVKDLKDWRKDMQDDVDNLKTWRKVHEVETNTMLEKIESILSFARWILVTILGAVIVSVLNLVLV